MYLPAIALCDAAGFSTQACGVLNAMAAAALAARPVLQEGDVISRLVPPGPR